MTDQRWLAEQVVDNLPQLIAKYHDAPFCSLCVTAQLSLLIQASVCLVIANRPNSVTIQSYTVLRIAGVTISINKFFSHAKLVISLSDYQSIRTGFRFFGQSYRLYNVSTVFMRSASTLSTSHLSRYQMYSDAGTGGGGGGKWGFH